MEWLRRLAGPSRLAARHVHWNQRFRKSWIRRIPRNPHESSPRQRVQIRRRPRLWQCPPKSNGQPVGQIGRTRKAEEDRGPQTVVLPGERGVTQDRITVAVLRRMDRRSETHNDRAVLVWGSPGSKEISDVRKLASVSVLVACRFFAGRQVPAIGGQIRRIIETMIRGDVDRGWAIRDADGPSEFRHNRECSFLRRPSS